MPRPNLPNADDVRAIAAALRAEGFGSVQIDTDPKGKVSIYAGPGEAGDMGPDDELKDWRKRRAAHADA